MMTHPRTRAGYLDTRPALWVLVLGLAAWGLVLVALHVGGFI